MSGTQRPSKEVVTSSQRKQVRIRGNVPPAPAIPWEQTRRFGLRAVVKEVDKAERKGFHQSLPYAHMSKKAWVWLKIVMNFLIPRLHYTDITCDRVCLVYALMTNTELNIGATLKSSMRKARVHKGLRYAFGGIITRLCCAAGVPYESLDYMAPLFPVLVDITKTKGFDNEFGPPLTTTERHHRDELIMARMYGLELLRHQNGCRASIEEQLGKLERRYPLNAHAKTLLGISPELSEHVDDDISIDEDRLHTCFDVEFDSDTEEVDPAQAGDEAEGGDTMED
ncbi:hypothetical protein H5410_015004 [Solanum commersonii]|uniref:Putative plant transposon protein domain-containing protein n=1 Tax=Solanum commersonii TaxID=4109 RepID=A0A9J5ZT35_SOLCO|nr:hypothetical protein H5410_015004 [Solanum commersonii]